MSMCELFSAAGGGGGGGWQGEVTTVAVTSQLPFNSRNNVDWECV